MFALALLWLALLCAAVPPLLSAADMPILDIGWRLIILFVVSAGGMLKAIDLIPLSIFDPKHGMAHSLAMFAGLVAGIALSAAMLLTPPPFHKLTGQDSARMWILIVIGAALLMAVWKVDANRLYRLQRRP